jgi:hypothetical protein
MEPHPGISMHRLNIGGGIMGLVFTAGTVAIFLVGIPALRWFLAAAVLAGAAIAAVLVALRKRRPVALIDIGPLERSHDQDARS